MAERLGDIDTSALDKLLAVKQDRKVHGCERLLRFQADSEKLYLTLYFGLEFEHEIS